MRAREDAVERGIRFIPGSESLLRQVRAHIDGEALSSLELVAWLVEELAPHEDVCRSLFEVAARTYGVHDGLGRYQTVAPEELRRNSHWWDDLASNLFQGVELSTEIARTCGRPASEPPVSEWRERAVWSMLLLAGVCRVVWGHAHIPRRTVNVTRTAIL
ncbi:MAG: hypothetical protein HYV63_28845 [Candidatus Schekmanbacteria bacterium]|nr:hypothetical protein [Candidatus Schekmanbacteria bacterium]